MSHANAGVLAKLRNKGISQVIAEETKVYIKEKTCEVLEVGLYLSNEISRCNTTGRVTK
jgi:hypothetical protein